ncbi:hypothetical protein TrRE_jg10887, partial [Triparma retinervis]
MNNDDDVSTSVKMKLDSDLKMNLVLNTITDLLSADSEVKEFVELHNSITPLTPLEITVLAGGLTNYSYKVHVADKSIFAKLAFNYALWNPDWDGNYDVVRTENEAIMMSKFHEIAPNSVAVPLHICDLKHPEIKSSEMK